MCSLPCSFSRTQHQSSCSSSFSSVSQGWCSQIVPGRQGDGQFELTGTHNHMTRDTRRSERAHQWAVGAFLKLSDGGGERANQIVRSVAVVVRAIHLQREAGGVSCDWWRAKLLLVVAVSSWWNLQWSFQVTGAERLQRNGELLPGGVQIVLHHLPTNHWHEPHHDKNTISILVTTLCVCLCTSVRWTSCHFPSSAFLKNSKNGSDFPNVSWRRRTQCDAISTHSLCAWGHFVHRGVSSKTKTLGLSKIHRTSGLTFLSRFLASNSNTMALLSLISSAVI